MTTKQMEYCIDLAELKNFTRVAEKNFISQQTLSFQIKSLEEELGVELFTRTKRSVELTPAGETFVAGAREMVGKLRSTLSEVKQTAGQGGTLTLVSTGVGVQVKLSEAIRIFADRNPGVRVELRQREAEDPWDGAWDLTTVKNISSLDGQLYGWMDCPMGPVMAVFSKKHPLAKQGEVTPEELFKEQYIFPCRKPETELHRIRRERVAALLGAFPPNVREVETRAEADMLLSSGMGYMLLGQDSAEIHNPNQIAYIPIKGVNKGFPLWFIWRKDNPNPALQNFLAVVRELEETK